MSNETHKVTSSIYISYNLLLEGSEHESIKITRVYNAPYLFYLIPLNLVGLVLGGQASYSTVCYYIHILAL